MGGKKPIGEHPSRGHLQRRFTSIARRGAHTHRGYNFEYGSKMDENENVVPVIQEFSLFSEFDISPDRFGILSKQIDKEKFYSKEDKLETVVVPPFQSGIGENIFRPEQQTSQEGGAEEEEGEEEDYAPCEGNQVEILQMTVFHLTSALERLEYQFYAAMNNIYCFGVPVPLTPTPGTAPGATTGSAALSTSSPPVATEESTSSLLKRVNERLSTLEGRQKTIQSKISQLDNLYGQSTQSWGKSIREILKANKQTFPGEASEGKEADNEAPLLPSSSSPLLPPSIVSDYAEGTEMGVPSSSGPSNENARGASEPHQKKKQSNGPNPPPPQSPNDPLPPPLSPTPTAHNKKSSPNSKQHDSPTLS
jgi:hypothetical protein